MVKRREFFCLATAGALAWFGFTRYAAAQTTSQASAPRLALKGYDPVAYFTEGRALQGKPEFEQVFDETRYRFVSDRHLALFRADPDRYVPRFSGSCAMGIAKGKKVEADPEQWMISDNRLFVFASYGARRDFGDDMAAHKAASERNWVALRSAPFGAEIKR